MLKIKLFFTVFLLMAISGMAQIFSGSGGVIQDNGSRNTYNLGVTGLSNINSGFGVYGVTVNITHSYVSDLNIFLVAPDNTVIELSSGNGGSGQDYNNCVFTNTVNSKIRGARAPFRGSYKPEGSLGVVNNSQNPNSTWSLVIVDTKPNRDSGTLMGWNIIFNNRPSKLEPFVNSNLPLILVNTFGKGIMDDPRIYAKMRIVNNISSPNAVADSGNFFNYGITIETRGSSSQSFPKKPYGFSTVVKSLADTNVSLLGLPEEHDWVLNATYNDKSLMRDVLAYELARRSGRYATRYRYCELFINGQYEGIYILMEKVKRDKNRVDVTKLELKDSTGNALTGGYIVKIDKTTGSNNGGWTDTFPIFKGSTDRVYFQYDYPNGDAMVKKQRDYIASAIYKFENALSSVDFASPTKGYRQFADEMTFIDYSIINEISKNVDGYRLSTYLFKDRDSKGGKLKMGPVWDFNLAFNNADYNNSSDPTGWEIDLSYGCPFWWKRFRADSGYVNSYYCRWNQLRQSSFSLYNINKFLDSTYTVLEEASYRNFQRWPVLGTYVWPNPSPLSYSMREEVDSLKSWIEKRVKWMDATLAVDCKTVKTCAPKVRIFADKKVMCRYQSVKLAADGIGNTFTWYAGKNVKPFKSGREVSVSPDSGTTYKVVMQTAKGCKDSATVTIKVLQLPLATITGKTSYCEGYSTMLNVPAGYKTYAWSPASGLDNTQSAQVTASYFKSINYKVVVTDSMGCHDSSNVTIAVNKKPILQMSALRDTVCATDSTILQVSGASVYKWSPAQGLKDSTGSQVTVYPADKATYTAMGTSDKGCLDTAEYTLYNFGRAPLSVDADPDICFGAYAMLTAKGGSAYQWQKTADIDETFGDVIRVFPRVNTTYQVKGLDMHGCRDSASMDINVYPEVVLTVSADTSICKGGEVSLMVSKADTYVWSDSDGDIGTEPEIKVSPLQTTVYTVIGTTVNSCNDTTSVKVTVNPLPQLDIQASALSIQEGQKDTIRITGALNYQWSPAFSLDKDTGHTVIASPMLSTLYSVIGVSKDQCYANDSIFITVTKKPAVGLASLSTGEFKIYPNPASDLVMIESPAEAFLLVYSIQGQAVYSSALDQGIKQVNISNWSKGIYVFCLRNASGSRYYQVVVD
jgi:subtilisin-like proprotein convertase family protein